MGKEEFLARLADDERRANIPKPPECVELIERLRKEHFLNWDAEALELDARDTETLELFFEWQAERFNDGKPSIGNPTFRGMPIFVNQPKTRFLVLP